MNEMRFSAMHHDDTTYIAYLRYWGTQETAVYASPDPESTADVALDTTAQSLTLIIKEQ